MIIEQRLCYFGQYCRQNSAKPSLGLTNCGRKAQLFAVMCVRGKVGELGKVGMVCDVGWLPNLPPSFLTYLAYLT